MADKIIQEVRFLETDDGYRIEINGDKEQLRQMGIGPGMPFLRGLMGFGRRKGGKRHGPHRHHRHHGPGRRHMRHRFGPWGRNWWGEEDHEAGEAAEKEPKHA